MVEEFSHCISGLQMVPAGMGFPGAMSQPSNSERGQSDLGDSDDDEDSSSDSSFLVVLCDLALWQKHVHVIMYTILLPCHSY